MNNFAAKKKRLDIQGLRALAVLGVVFYHYGWIKGGYVGVDIFFVVSGFVITNVIVSEIQSTNSFNIFNFFAQRIRRLIPALSLILFLVLVASFLLESPSGEQQSTLKVALAGMMFGSNFLIPRVEGNYFDAVLGDNPLLHIWSLSVEEQFYLIVPLVVFCSVLIKNTLNRKITNTFFLVIFLLMFLVSIFLTYFIYFVKPDPILFPNLDSLLFYSPITRAWEFLVGSMVACTPNFLANRGKFTATLGVFGYMLIFILIVIDLSLGKNIIVYAPIVCLGTALVIMTASSIPKGIRRIVESQLFSWVGDRSYSIYLFHWPILVFGNILTESLLGKIIFLLLTLLMSHYCYIFWENRFRLKSVEARNFTKRRTSIALMTLIPSVFLSFLFYQGNQKGWNTDWALGSHSGIRLDCDVPPFKPEICTWGINEASERVLVVGDSQSWAVADGVIEAGGRVGKRVTLASHNNCPFVFAIDFEPSNHCQDWQRNIIAWMEINNPEYVIIANAEYGGQLDGKIALDIVRNVRSMGSEVIWILNPIPAPENLIRSSLLFPISDKDRSFNRPGLDDAKLSLQNILANEVGVHVINPSDYLCSTSTCYVSKNGAEFYTDQNHLSVSGARLLSRELISILS